MLHACNMASNIKTIKNVTETKLMNGTGLTGLLLTPGQLMVVSRTRNDLDWSEHLEYRE